jgi:hypothetical protein
MKTVEIVPGPEPLSYRMLAGPEKLASLEMTEPLETLGLLQTGTGLAPFRKT